MIKRLYNKFINSFKTKYTQTVSKNENEQCYEYKCYKNGKYTHTAKIGYFTEEQINRFIKIGENIQLNNKITLKCKI